MAKKTQKKKSLGATRRKAPFPYRLWLIRSGVFCSLIVALGALWLMAEKAASWQFTVMPVKQISLAGPLHYQNQAQFDEAIAEFYGNSLLVINLEEMREKLEALPWIQQVTLAKNWPGNISVRVVEFEPVANWNHNKVLNEEGFPLQQPELSMALADLNGPDDRSADVMEHYLLFNDIFSVQGLLIKGVTLQPRGSWSLHLANGVDILLGEQNVVMRSRRVVQFFQTQRFQNTEVEYVDARYQNGIAIKIKQKQSSEVEHDVAA